MNQNMKITFNISNFLILSMRSLAVVFLFAMTTNCTNEESLVEPVSPETEEAVDDAAVSAAGESASLTVSGAFVEYADGNLCSECTYVIPEDAKVVDGTKVGIEAGDVICLSSAFSYGSIEVINVEGTESNPVVIATCAE